MWSASEWLYQRERLLVTFQGNVAPSLAATGHKQWLGLIKRV
ncbi:MAG: hypothetical protein ACFFD4_25465 [Candidatus Odinarchaeota archaeon]